MYCFRPASSRPVAWICPRASEQIQTSRHAGGMTRLLMRSRVSSSTRDPSAARYEKPRPCRRRLIPGSESETYLSLAARAKRRGSSSDISSTISLTLLHHPRPPVQSSSHKARDTNRVARTSSPHNLPSVRVQRLSRDVGCLVGGQPHIARGHLLRLAGAAQRRALPELLDLIGREGSRDERRPDWPGCHGVNADVLLGEALRECPRECDDGTFRG